MIDVDWAKRNLASDLPSSKKRIPKRQHIDTSCSDYERQDDVAPPILELDNAEKFRDADGEMVEVETCGQRRVGEVFFKASDVSKLIDGNGESMRLKLLHQTSSYVCGIDEDFYAVRVVQTAQMGSDDDRVALAANIAKADLRTAQYVFKECIPPPAGVYLISIGQFKDLRSSLELDINAQDDDEIVKFGRSENCAVRLNQHLTDYGALCGARPTFLAQIAVNPFKSARVEELVKRFFTQKGWMLRTSGNELLKNGDRRHRHRDELAIIPKSQLKKEGYKRLGADFRGGYSEILAKNTGLEKIMEQQKIEQKRNVEHLTELSALKLQTIQDVLALKLAAAEKQIEQQQREIEHLKEIFALKLAASLREVEDAQIQLAARNKRIAEPESALRG
ncbi:hypothetical protein HDU86_003259 [Geranomyces michiganensis]|nr:hypothetical protein HDU86_003259 [Geranomyces michiganensis]